MNRPTLKDILQSAYDRNQWISTLQFLTGKRELLTVHLSPIAIDIHTQEADRLIKYFHQIGSVKTSDGVNLPIFEIILEDAIKIEYNRVGVNEFIKNYIIKDAVKGALVTFSYDENHDKTEWRFSFISKNSASDFFAEAEAQETNPKKFTYIFGTDDEHRTAIERLYNLEQSRFRLEDFFEAFNVEPVSKKFFEEYKNYYREFSDHLIVNYPELFIDNSEKDEKERDKKTEKEIRNFVGRLLGRIVFLYFLQKKNWLGASDTEYTDGSTSFLSDLFFNDNEDQEDFYSKYLCPVFFNALNSADRKNDEFKIENGKIVCIPFLNGGLFEEEQEPTQHRTIKFPAHQFKMLFDFFNGFNFTVYENSPEEHTVAVDPEMLGHIFENLIDYNKDTGTFYTPKEIVQYMTQESLAEYLNTHLEKDRTEIENIIKNQSATAFSDAELSQINTLLDDVKICDPAIGSGAFPMGMLQEIFNLKALINYRLGFEVWSPATVKQNIIQNSIYGVDLDEGAVEIARLRFWLSLVVDEGKPKALPNLDYKIMQGNSLLESFRGIDLSNLENVQEQGIIEQSVIDYGQDFATQITLFDNISFESLKQLVNKYFIASNSGSKIKSILKNQIDDYIEGKIHAKIFWEKDRFKNLIEKFYTKYNIEKDNNLEGFNLKSKELKEFFVNKKNFDELSSIENELISLQSKKDRPYFLWNLYFAEVLDNGGFDIVIGNPPYGVSIKGDYRNDVLKTYGKVPDFEIYYFFIELADRIVKNEGILSYIIPNTYLFNTFASSYRVNLLEKWNLVEILDCTKFNIFQSATVRNTINLWKKGNRKSVGYRKTKGIESFVELTSRERSQISFSHLLELNQNWGLAFSLDNAIVKIISNIKYNRILLSEVYPEISQGLIAYDKYQGQSEEIISTRAFHYDSFEKEDLKRWLWGEDVTKYKIKWNGKEYIDYNGEIANPRDPKFFFGERLLVREITNPSIFSAITSEEYYNDPSIIIVKSNENYSVKWLCAVINSKLATFYHFNHSPKATKGAFPKILVKDIKEFPTVIPQNVKPFEILVDYLIFLNEKQNKNETTFKNQISSFQEIVDAMVFELYFSNEFKQRNIVITKNVEVIFKSIEDQTEVEKSQIVAESYQKYREKNNELRNQIKLMKIELNDLLLPILSI